MSRFLWLLRSELAMVRSAVPVHLVAAFQPTIFFLLLAGILVNPTMTMSGIQATGPQSHVFYEALAGLTSSEGVPYARLILYDEVPGDTEQFITFEPESDPSYVKQSFGLIDSNRVKNYRNRLTAAGLSMWNDDLQSAVQLRERPWLAHEPPFSVYFGIALLAFAVILSGAIIGAVSGAREFESETVIEYRLSPVQHWMPILARMLRLGFWSLVSVAILLVAIGVSSGWWPAGFWRLVLVLLPTAVIASALGIALGLIFQKTMPSYVAGLSLAVAGWIFGGGLGLPSSFGGAYETLSSLTPNAHAIVLLFPLYYGEVIGDPATAILASTTLALLFVAIMVIIYRRRITEAT